MAHPMWFRWLREARAWHRYTQANSFNPRLYSSTTHDSSANITRVTSAMPKSLVALCVMSPSWATARYTRLNPNSDSHVRARRRDRLPRHGRRWPVIERSAKWSFFVFPLRPL